MSTKKAKLCSGHSLARDPLLSGVNVETTKIAWYARAKMAAHKQVYILPSAVFNTVTYKVGITSVCKKGVKYFADKLPPDRNCVRS